MIDSLIDYHTQSYVTYFQLTGTVYPKKYAHGFCFAVLCCGYILTDFPISIRLTSLALWQSNDCPSASKATLMNMDKYFMWIHYERLHNHNKAKHNKTVCIFLGIYCTSLKLCPWFSVCWFSLFFLLSATETLTNMYTNTHRIEHIKGTGIYRLLLEVSMNKRMHGINTTS